MGSGWEWCGRVWSPSKNNLMRHTWKEWWILWTWQEDITYILLCSSIKIFSVRNSVPMECQFGRFPSRFITLSPLQFIGIGRSLMKKQDCLHNQPVMLKVGVNYILQELSIKVSAIYGKIKMGCLINLQHIGKKLHWPLKVIPMWSLMSLWMSLGLEIYSKILLWWCQAYLKKLIYNEHTISSLQR